MAAFFPAIVINCIRDFFSFLAYWGFSYMTRVANYTDIQQTITKIMHRLLQSLINLFGWFFFSSLFLVKEKEQGVTYVSTYATVRWLKEIPCIIHKLYPFQVTIWCSASHAGMKTHQTTTPLQLTSSLYHSFFCSSCIRYIFKAGVSNSLSPLARSIPQASSQARSRPGVCSVGTGK